MLRPVPLLLNLKLRLSWLNMTPEQFAYWLQGFAELNMQTPTTAQWVSIMEHLSTVFKKVTPPVLSPAFYAPIVPGDKAVC